MRADRNKLAAESGVTLIEMIVVVVVLGLLAVIAIGTFLGSQDAAHNSEAQANLTNAFHTSRASHVTNKRTFGPTVAETIAQLERDERGLSFHDYGEDEQPSSGPRDISVTQEDPRDIISFCARSESGLFYCIRGDERGQLLSAEESAGLQHAGAAGSPLGRILAAVNPLAAEPAYAYGGPDFANGSDFRTVSRCTGRTEPDARACLATRAVREGENAGPGGTGTPGWVSEGEVSELDEDSAEPQQPEPEPEQPADPDPEPGPQVTLTVSVEGDGTVTGPGIDCPGDCSESFAEGSSVQLSAAPADDSELTGWTQACAGSVGSSCLLELEESRAAAALFEPSSHGYADRFSYAGVQAQDQITINANAEIYSSIHSGGNVTISSNSYLCGDLIHNGTVTAHKNFKHHCGERFQQPLSLDPVDQGDAPANNDNGRLFDLDPMGPGANEWNTIWNPSSRTLTLYSNGSVTLGGGVYSLCRLELSSNTTLRIQPGKNPLIFFDDPVSCGIGAGTPQLVLNSNSRITSSGSPENTSVQLLFVGSTERASRIELRSNTALPEACVLPTIVYAPRTDVIINSNATYCGHLAAKTLRLDSNSEIRVYNPAE